MVWILLSRRFATIKHLHQGAIILCHNGAKYTADALDAMLTNLEEQGYKIVPISKLIMKKNYHMDATGKQIADDAENKRRRRR